MRLADILLYALLSFLVWALIDPTAAEHFLRSLW